MRRSRTVARMLNRYRPIVIFPALLLLAGCAITGDDEEKMRFLREKSAEIGSKDVVMFDTRKRATDAVIRECLGNDVETVDKIACILLALEIVDNPPAE